jgi:hypothetical protein
VLINIIYNNKSVFNFLIFLSWCDMKFMKASRILSYMYMIHMSSSLYDLAKEEKLFG